MFSSRIIALILVLGAALWIGSGHFGSKTDANAAGQNAQPEQKLFRVAVVKAETVERSRKLNVSGRTEADRRTTAVARSSGVGTDLKVRRGSEVKEGDVLAILSDEAREANVTQAQARVDQRKREFEARRALIETGNLPKLNAAQLEADLKGAEAALALAIAERDRGNVTAPISGFVNDVPVVVGQALQPGAPVAEVLALDPMLAVVEISERRLGSVREGDRAEVKLVTGQSYKGQVRFVSNRASPQTRTYRVDVGLPNPDRKIPDGVTAEVSLWLAAVPATRVPRSVLTFSAEGKLGVRAVDAKDVVMFIPVSLVEDETQYLWVSGIPDGTRLIVQGQDFVKEGQKVEPVPAAQS